MSAGFSARNFQNWGRRCEIFDIYHRYRMLSMAEFCSTTVKYGGILLNFLSMAERCSTTDPLYTVLRIERFCCYEIFHPESTFLYRL